jgi:hypothetical protein
MSGSGFLDSCTPLSIDEVYEAIDKLAPEFEAEARKSEIERRPTEALAELMRRTKIPLAELPKSVGGCETRPSEQISPSCAKSQSNQKSLNSRVLGDHSMSIFDSFLRATLA